MKATTSCTIVGQMNTNDALNNFTKYSAVAGKSGNYYYTYFQKFTIPEFKGKAEQLDFTVAMKSAYGSGWALRAAVIDSMDSYESYISAYAPLGEVTDSHQVGATVVTFESLSTVPKQVTISVPVSGVKAGTYYLVLWAYTAVGMTIEDTDSGYGAAVTTATVETNLGPTCHVYDGSAWVQVQPYVYDGSAWGRVTPNIGGA